MKQKKFHTKAKRDAAENTVVPPPVCRFDTGWGTCREERAEGSPYCRRHQLFTPGGQVAVGACGETWGPLVCGRLLADHESCDCRSRGTPL